MSGLYVSTVCAKPKEDAMMTHAKDARNFMMQGKPKWASEVAHYFSIDTLRNNGEIPNIKWLLTVIQFPITG